jgi:hypothetical protein
LESISNERCTPLYLSQREEENFKPAAEFREYDFLEYTTLPGASVREPETSSFWYRAAARQGPGEWESVVVTSVLERDDVTSWTST